MRRKKRLLALLLCGCLFVGLAACGVQSEKTSGVPAAEKTESDGNTEESKAISTEKEADKPSSVAEEESEDSSEGAPGETDNETVEEVEQDVSEDGEARDDITTDEALELVIDQFGTEDPDSGYAYDYSLERADEIDGQAYYIYKQTWAPDEEDAEAGAKVLCYIFVATDGSVMYTGVVDGGESVIDYDTEITF